MRIKYPLFLIVILFLFNFCNSPKGNKKENIAISQSEDFSNEPKVDLLDTILKRKTLIALTSYSSTDYFIYKGVPMGYQYEMAMEFADYLGVNLEMKVEKNLNRSFELLDSLKADLLTMGLTVTAERKEKALFTKPILFTRQVLVQRKPEGWEKMRTRDEIESHLIRNVLELGGKTIYVHKGTVFVERLKNLMKEIADTIIIKEDKRETEELIEAVAKGEIDYTISDEYMALVDESFYRNIDVKTYISFPQKVSWAVRKDQKRLRAR